MTKALTVTAIALSTVALVGLCIWMLTFSKVSVLEGKSNAHASSRNDWATLFSDSQRAGSHDFLAPPTMALSSIASSHQQSYSPAAFAAGRNYPKSPVTSRNLGPRQLAESAVVRPISFWPESIDHFLDMVNFGIAPKSQTKIPKAWMEKWTQHLSPFGVLPSNIVSYLLSNVDQSDSETKSALDALLFKIQRAAHSTWNWPVLEATLANGISIFGTDPSKIRFDELQDMMFLVNWFAPESTRNALSAFIERYDIDLSGINTEHDRKVLLGEANDFLDDYRKAPVSTDGNKPGSHGEDQLFWTYSYAIWQAKKNDDVTADLRMRIYPTFFFYTNPKLDSIRDQLPETKDVFKALIANATNFYFWSRVHPGLTDDHLNRIINLLKQKHGDKLRLNVDTTNYLKREWKYESTERFNRIFGSLMSHQSVRR